MPRSLPHRLSAVVLVVALGELACGLDYAYAPYNAGAMDPQKTGWPPTENERAHVLKAEYDRRRSREGNQHKPALWPVTPSAGFWGGMNWLDFHAGFVKRAEASKGSIDVLLVGGDKTQTVLWRLDHGGIDGLKAKACALLIGNNDMFFTNMFFAPETGIEPTGNRSFVCACPRIRALWRA